MHSNFQRDTFDIIFGPSRRVPKNRREFRRRRYVHCARRWLDYLSDFETFQMRKLIFKRHCAKCEAADRPFHRNKHQFRRNP